MGAREINPANGRGDVSLATICDQYIADLSTRAKPGSIRDSKSALARFVAELDELTPRAVMLWRLKRISEGVAHKTINTQVGALKAALSLAVRMGQLVTHPLAGLPSLPVSGRHQRRKARALTEAEADALIRAAQDADSSPNVFPRAPFVQALVLTGARYGELAQVTWGDFDGARCLLTFRGENTKTNTERTVPVDSDLARSIELLRWQHKRFSGREPTRATRIFLAPEGRPWGKTSAVFLRQLDVLFKRAGIPKVDELGRIVHAHCLRHTFATRLARNGVPLATAQVLTGHKSPSVLLGVYTHLRAEEARNAIEGLPRLGGGGNFPGGQTDAPSRAVAAQEQFGFDDEESGSPGRARTYNNPVNSRVTIRESDMGRPVNDQATHRLRLLPPSTEDESSSSDV